MPRGVLVTEIPVPTAGARSDEAPHRLPPTATPADETSNVLLRDGWLVNRPGFAAINTTLVTGRPMGLHHFRVGSSSKFLVIGTLSKLVKLKADGTGYDDLTGATALTGAATDHIRFAVFPQGGSDYLIAVNDVNVPQEWDGVAATFSDVGGTPPIAADVTVAANRLVYFRTIESGTRYNFRVRWGALNNRASYPAENFADLSDTADIMVGGRALSRIQFAVYKESSQWVGLAQSGTQPFKFEIRDTKPGPLSTAVVVDAEGRHYYLGNDASVYTFDGIRTVHIGGPIRRWIESHLNVTAQKRAFGFFGRRDRDIYWIFPASNSEDPAIGISYNVDTGVFFPHEFGFALSCGTQWEYRTTVTWADLAGFTWANIAATYPTWNSFGTTGTAVEALGGVNRKIFQFGLANTDDGTAPAAAWTSPTLSLNEKSKRARLQSFETYFEAAASSLTATVAVTTSDHVAAAPTAPSGLSTTFDVSQSALLKLDVDTADAGAGDGTAETRYARLEHSLNSSIAWRWGGAVLRSAPLESA